jgi:SAM-dependent methyltransferase
MAHPNQQNFCLRVKDSFPEHFTHQKVLDAGSLDINGSNKDLFDETCEYLGVDVALGKNVDIVSTIHEISLPDESFDVVVSTECFEHDQYYQESLKNIARLLKPGGLFFFSCASTDRPEHGTARCHPDSSPLTAQMKGWQDYYKNLTEADVREAINVDEIFPSHYFEYNPDGGDLYFWGIKAPGDTLPAPPPAA